MKRILRRTALIVLLCCIGFIVTHGTALATTHCSLPAMSGVTNNMTGAEVVEGYNVFATANGSNTYNFTFNISCNGNGSTTLQIYFLGMSSSSYTEPYLSGPASSQLLFELCVPGTGSCSNTSGTIWNSSNPLTINCTSPSNCVTMASNVTGSVYASPGQNMYVGTSASYSQTVYFSMAST
jgi:hypothetical protein